MPFFSVPCMSSARLHGKTAVVTGCNTGIGKETVKDFYRRGARVIMACRNLQKAQESVDLIKTSCAALNETTLGELEVTELDLSNLQSVRDCADRLLKSECDIQLLVNNAGVMMCPLERTADGFEMQLGTNHLGHFLLTCLLLPRLISSGPSRIVTVSSVAHKNGVMDFDDLNFNTRSYSSLKAYSQSKLANVLFTKDLARRLKENNIDNVSAYCLHPGVIQTELGRHLDKTIFPGARRLFGVVGKLFIKTPVQGAQTTIYCSVDEHIQHESGLYYAECASTDCASVGSNVEDARKLWDESLRLVNTDDPFKLLQKL